GIPGLSRKAALYYSKELQNVPHEDCDCFEWMVHAGIVQQKDIPSFERIIDCRETVVSSIKTGDIPEALHRCALGMGITETSLDTLPWKILNEKAGNADSPAELFALLGMQKDADVYDPRAEGVAMMTLHAAKGLEWNTVFIVGCEDGLVPLSDGGRETDYDEERRLLYVGMTRAKKNLIVSWAKNRTVYGSRKKRKPSPFLDAIPETVKNYQAISLPRRAGKSRNGAIQMQLFD
ncbi:MAG: hypothetical protein GF350_11820, partial [Chitinivibrionales bacterium]|nr:hypothetical protein [Chitinivibrionales bacterium]